MNIKKDRNGIEIVRDESGYYSVRLVWAGPDGAGARQSHDKVRGYVTDPSEVPKLIEETFAAIQKEAPKADLSKLKAMCDAKAKRYKGRK